MEMIIVQVARMMRDDEIGVEVGDRGLDEFDEFHQRKRVESEIRKLTHGVRGDADEFVGATHVGPKLFEGRPAGSRLGVAAQDDGEDLPSRSFEGTRRSAERKNFVVRVGDDDEGTTGSTGHASGD